MIFFFHIETMIEVKRPCQPPPCGANAICRENNGAGSCACLPDYVGDPYQGCRPECNQNSDCSLTQACISLKCGDPCPGTCGPNAQCQPVNHVPICTCSPGYTGDPFRYCVLQPTTRKIIYKSSLVDHNYQPFILNKFEVHYYWKYCMCLTQPQ